jgi:hypothetical protein
MNLGKNYCGCDSVNLHCYRKVPLLEYHDYKKLMVTMITLNPIS